MTPPHPRARQSRCWDVSRRGSAWPSGAGVGVDRCADRTPCPSGWEPWTVPPVLQSAALRLRTQHGVTGAAWCLSSGTMEHTAHPSAVLSLLWPLGFAFLPSEQAEQRPLCAPVSTTCAALGHTHSVGSCSPALSPNGGQLWSPSAVGLFLAGPWARVGDKQVDQKPLSCRDRFNSTLCSAVKCTMQERARAAAQAASAFPVGEHPRCCSRHRSVSSVALAPGVTPGRLDRRL